MPIPRAKRAVVEREKLVEYLLNPDHPRGGSKTRLIVRVDIPEVIRRPLNRICVNSSSPAAYNLSGLIWIFLWVSNCITMRAYSSIRPRIIFGRGFGTVVAHHETPKGNTGYSVEFFNLTGKTIAVVSVSEESLRQPSEQDVATVRVRKAG